GGLLFFLRFRGCRRITAAFELFHQRRQLGIHLFGGRRLLLLGSCRRRRGVAATFELLHQRRQLGIPLLAAGSRFRRGRRGGCFRRCLFLRRRGFRRRCRRLLAAHLRLCGGRRPRCWALLTHRRERHRHARLAARGRELDGPLLAPLAG